MKTDNSITAAFHTGNFQFIDEIMTDAAERADGELMLVPLAPNGQPDHKGASLETIMPAALPIETMADAARLCVFKTGVAGCEFDSSFIFHLTGQHESFVCRQLSGPPADKQIAFLVFCKAIGAKASMVPVMAEPEPIATDAENDNRALVPMPAMHPEPFTPEAAGGLMGDIAQWITRTAIVPSPELSLASSVALMGGAFGRYALGPTNSGVNVFITTLLATASGKAHPPKAIRTLAEAAGQYGAVTNGDPTSYAAIERMLRKNPSTVISMDEFGLTLQDVNAKHRNSVAAGIRKFLLAIFDQANSSFDGRIYASADTKKDEPIIGPALTVLGMTTTTTLYQGLSADSVSDGFLNRFIFVTTEANDGEITVPKLHRDSAPPAELVERFRAAIAAFPKSGNLAKTKVQVSFDGDEDGEAYRRWSEIFLWQHHQAWDETERAINGRVAENTIRLATLRAISREAAAPLICVDDVEWGWAIVHQSIQLIMDGTEKHMSASPAEALRKSILAVLREAPEGTMAFSTMLRKRGISGADMRDVEGALNWLVQSGEITDLNRRIKPGQGSKFRCNTFAPGVATA